MDILPDVLQTGRSIIVITGSQSECINHAQKLTANMHCLELNEPKKANDYLGQEFDAVIFHTYEVFDPNAFGAITGTIRGGGYLLLLKPGYYPEDSLFLKHFDLLLDNNQKVQFIDPATLDKECEIKPLAIPKHEKPSQQSGNPCATNDQKKAVNAIIRVVKGHRRRPLVITSDRGRGKSAALGIAAAKLAQDGVNNIIVCAPSKKTAAVIFQHAGDINSDVNLHFYSPDVLQKQKPEADLVLIDEAAAIPIPLLTGFLKNYSRIVFASTQHGYEGSGRGFAISFRKVLDKLTPGWKNCYLQTPIRWKENDSLEQFVFDSLLLNAEPVDIAQISEAKLSNCSFSLVDKKQLLENPSSLKELFGLLASAHYQTRPSDLKQLLDEQSMSVYAMQFQQSIVAVALVVKEGGIDQQLGTDIFAGTRRIKGHLVAQSLAANAGIDYAPTLHGERIIRIAIHPALQHQGFGTHLLKTLSENSKADYLSTSFGASTQLLKFWQQSNFTAVYLGMKRDASSGTHSVVMLQAKNKQGGALLEDARSRFIKHYPHLLADPLRNLEADIGLALLAIQQTEPISAAEEKELLAFANQQRGYENTIYPIWKLVCQKLGNNSKLNYKEQQILLLKVLQKHTWKSISKKMFADSMGKKDVLKLLRQAVAKLLE